VFLKKSSTVIETISEIYVVFFTGKKRFFW
jgi:hypothetical protein